MDKRSPKRIALVVVKQEHEWNQVQMTYALVEQVGGWKVVWFRPGGETPGGTFGRLSLGTAAGIVTFINQIANGGKISWVAQAAVLTCMASFPKMFL